VAEDKLYFLRWNGSCELQYRTSPK